MKTLLSTLAFIALFTSCSTELSEEQYRTALNDSCNKSMLQLTTNETLTDVENAAICECITQKYVSEAESYSLGEIMKMAKNASEMQERVTDCEDDVIALRSKSTEPIMLKTNEMGDDEMNEIE